MGTTAPRAPRWSPRCATFRPVSAIVVSHPASAAASLRPSSNVFLLRLANDRKARQRRRQPAAVCSERWPDAAHRWPPLGRTTSAPDEPARDCFRSRFVLESHRRLTTDCPAPVRHRLACSPTAAIPAPIGNGGVGNSDRARRWCVGRPAGPARRNPGANPASVIDGFAGAGSGRTGVSIAQSLARPLAIVSDFRHVTGLISRACRSARNASTSATGSAPTPAPGLARSSASPGCLPPSPSSMILLTQLASLPWKVALCAACRCHRHIRRP